MLALDTGLNDLCRLILVSVNADLKEHLDDWIKLYYEAFDKGTKDWNVANPYTPHLCQAMFDFHYPEELNFSLMILGLEYQKADDEAVRQRLVDRMISSFERVRNDYE